MADINRLLETHRGKSVLLDTNLLVLYLVGSVNRARILTFKRTQAYTISDFDLLRDLVTWFGALVTTPHVLAQTSDLAVLHGKEFPIVRQLFKTIVSTIDERYEESRRIVADRAFPRLGLTDSAIALVTERDPLVLTDDLELSLELERRGAAVLNFNHLRVWTW